jgi:hypothetical protein
MIHRIDRVNPDVDDRVIKPNEARIAVNLRFGASTDDTNLSGGTLILGNKKIDSFVPPAGANKVVGVYADLESRNVFFAMYNSEGNHGLYRINGATNVVQTILSYQFLNFQPEDSYDVSMAVIDGLLYWTDGINEPRVVNIEKSIRTTEGQTTDVYLYPFRVENYSQAKRPPGIVPNVYRLYEQAQGNTSVYYILNTRWTPREASRDYQPNTNLYDRDGFGNEQAFQFSYYYVYDNNEESRLAPWSEPVFWKKNIVVQVPQEEFSNYFLQTGIIKSVVFVYRANNDGVVASIRSIDNKAANYYQPSLIPSYTPFYGQQAPGLPFSASIVDFSDAETIQTVVRDMTNVAKTPVSTDITDQRFDSVPLVSKTNTIAQNRLNHANYVLDRDTWNDLSLSLTIEQDTSNNISGEGFIDQIFSANQKIFKPGGLYEVGIELLDINGRPIGIIANKEIVIPTARTNMINISDLSSSEYLSSYEDIYLNTYRVKYQINGTFPSWAKYCRVVCTGAKNVNYFYRGIGTIYYWYQANDGSDVCVLFNIWNGFNFVLPKSIKDLQYNKIYQYKGIAVEKTNMPVSFSEDENLYLKIAEQFSDTETTGTRVEMQDLKIVKGTGNLLYAATGETNFPPVVFNGNGDENDNPITCFNPLWYNIEVYSKKSVGTSIFYQSGEIITLPILQDTPIEGYVAGDCYNTASIKTYVPGNSVIGIIDGDELNAGRQPAGFDQKFFYPGPLANYPGVFTAMNPSDVYAQNWVWSKGQEGIVNENQRAVPIYQGIIFSGILIQGTQVNGLNKFNSLDFRQAPAENGPITSLVTTNATQREPGVLLAIGTFGISSFYYDAIQLTNVDGSNNVTTTDAYLASQRPLVGQYGTSRPMSVTKTPLGTVYWWSDVVNDLIRYSNAGLERLGNTFSFSNYLRKKYNDNPLLITWYDQVTDEINLLGRFQNTAVFSERYKTFQGERQYWKAGPTGPLYPQRAIGLPTKQYWFINGEIYVADVEANRVETPPNFIFDAFKNPSVQVVTNEAPSAVKRWNQVKVFGHRPVEVNLRAPIDNGGELVSSILPEYFINRKGDWEAAIRRAENTTGGLLAGKLMESRIIYSNFAFSAEGFEKLNFIEVKSNVSIVQ